MDGGERGRVLDGGEGVEWRTGGDAALLQFESARLSMRSMNPSKVLNS